MKKFIMLLLGAVAPAASLFSQGLNDSISNGMKKEFDLNEVVIVAKRTVLKNDTDRIVYLTKNDP